MCSRWLHTVLNTLHSTSRLILTSCLWTTNYHFHHFTGEETHSRASAINHCHIEAHKRENTTYHTGTALGTVSAQKVLAPCLCLYRTSLSLLHRRRNKHAIILQSGSTRVGGKLRHKRIGWMLNTVFNTLSPSIPHLPLLPLCPPAAPRDPFQYDTQSLEWCPIRAFPHQHRLHHRKNYSNDLTLVWC